jgi:adenylate cyclase
LTQEFPIERKLTAVLSADVEGFSRLIEADETSTLQNLASQRRILDDLIGRYRGRVVNTAGDSVLAEFPSVADAVQCAVDTQKAHVEAAERLPNATRVLFRIGIHLGDVAVRGNDLLGNGVNIAARLQSIAPAGGIVISGAAHEQVRKILPLTYNDLGTQNVKNIEEPIRAFAIHLTDSSSPGAVVTIRTESKPLSLPDKPSIAVLPFQNMSGDPEQEYFADGMVEDITTALSRFKSLFVIARNSSFTYKGKAVDIKEVGRELGVRYVLEGSVRKAGGRVRITGQLIEAATGAHLWADKFDGTLEDIFDLHDDVTLSVVSAISPKLEQAEFNRARQKPTTSMTAYDYYLRGDESFRLETDQGYADAWKHLQQAIALDASFAIAYGKAARIYGRRLVDGLIGPDPAMRKQAEVFARKALEFGQDDDRALCDVAIFHSVMLRDQVTAGNLLKQAITLNPNNLTAWVNYAWVSLFAGDPEEALGYLAKATRLSPVDPQIYYVETATSWAHLLKHNFDDVTLWAGRALARRPGHVLALRAKFYSLALQGRHGDTRSMLAIHPRIITHRTISEARSNLHYHRSEDVDLICEALRKAGIPE